MFGWMRLLGAIPQHMIQRQEFFLYGAILCMAGGLLLLIIAVVVMKLRNRRADGKRK